ncbi:DUF2007 domain-containing protein [Sphingomonas rhizophila]|uniref:DUF2007 domain-containing protein n=1 Tax=Sphingomonas rhizophila TaxID=2071607 RepID=A0A7G9SAF7_9SPHN|nr:DUF2007 domain-containing protein [Sphingomonas rhizophila]QNN64832.1 DUF2007 domain-containing protein [Sphingomonas rhizophila]
MSLVELGRYASHVDADVDRLALQARGIDAVLFDAETNNFFGAGGLIWVRLMVLDEDLDAARQLLSREAGGSPGRG